MMEEKLEQELKAFDFSLCHAVREQLWDKLITMHRADNAALTGKHSRKWAAARLDEEELDWAAAAGTAYGNNRNPQSGEKNFEKNWKNE